MPWSTPAIQALRQRSRDAVAGALGVAVLPNGEVRVLADVNAGMAGLALEYLDWQAKQYLPDTAEQAFLDRWADIYLLNADGSRGRKLATYAAGAAKVTALAPTLLPDGSILLAGNVAYAVAGDALLGIGPNTVPVRALDAGAVGNLAAGTPLSLLTGVVGVSGMAGITVVSMAGGADEESDDELRVRVLDRIRKPPMGGDADDYVAWTLEVPGVTRAWCSPNEMGIGTVTVRFMMDDLRATDRDTTSGFPNDTDVARVRAYLDVQRPVAVKDFFVVGPIPERISFKMRDLEPDSRSDREAIKASVRAMLLRKAAPARALNGVRQPAQTIYKAWVSNAIYQTRDVNHFDLALTGIAMVDHAMPTNGSLAVLGDVY